MMTALQRRMALPLLCLCITACGRKAAPPNRADPNAPAVVALPPVVLASDTAKPDTAESHAEKMGLAQNGLAMNNAILSTAIVFGDRNMIATIYTQDAALVTPDSTYRGVLAIANALAAFGAQGSLRDFRRQSRGFRLVDSTVVDSGTYIAVTKRAGADSIAERGSYLSTWKMRKAPQSWLLRHDEMRPSAGKRRKSGP